MLAERQERQVEEFRTTCTDCVPTPRVDSLPSEVCAAISAAAGGTRVLHAHPVASRGYSHALHWVVVLDGKGRAFAKAAVDERTAGWLRAERAMYERVPSSLAPTVLGWADDPTTVLLLEDLSASDYPPPWTPGRVDLVLESLAELHALPVGDRFREAHEQYGHLCWDRVVEDPEPLLSTGLCSREWLARALPVLVSAGAERGYDGDHYVHLDVRSDNLFFREGRAVLVDWNLAAVGNPEFDVGFWLPSLAMEGGPAPEDVAALPPGVVASVSGVFASCAGLPEIPEAPRVRGVQRRQLAVALPWVARALDLPPPLG